MDNTDIQFIPTDTELQAVTTVLEDKPKTAQQIAPKGARTQEERDALGQKIKDTIDAAVRAKGDLPKRIRVNEDYYRNRIVKPAKRPWKGAEFFHIPLMAPRLDQRATHDHATIFSQDRLFRLKRLGSNESLDAVEQTVQFFLDMVGFDNDVAMALDLAMYTNQPWFRITYQTFDRGYEKASHDGPFHGIVFDVIHPDYAVVYPANSGGIRLSRLCGHEFSLRRAAVEQEIHLKRYLDDFITTSEGTELTRDGFSDVRPAQNKRANNGDPKDEPIRLFDVIWRDDLDDSGIEKLYRVILAYETAKVLYIEPYTLPYHWYVSMAIKREWDNFWAEGSPAQDVQGLQILINAIWNRFVWYTDMNSRPAVLQEGTPLPDELASYEPGEVRSVRRLGNAMPVPSKFDPSGFDVLINLIRTFADAATKTSETLTGAPSNAREATATEQNIKYEAFQLASSNDVMAIAPALRQICKVMLNLLHDNFNDWYPLYKDAVAIHSAEELKGPFIIDLAGKSPADSPQLQSQQAQMLLQMLMNMAQTLPPGWAPFYELLKTIVASTTLSNKDVLLRAIDDAQQQSQAQVAQQEPAMQGAEPPNGTIPNVQDILALAGMAGNSRMASEPQG